MSFSRILISSLAVLLGSACISLPDVDSPQEDAGVPTSPADSGQPPSDGGSEPDASTPTNLTVNLLAPSDKVFTNDTVDIQVQVTGGTADSVQLLIDDEVLTTLVPPYTYQWSTKAVAEGAYRIRAQALLPGKTFTSEPREVMVDRTPPQVASRAPTPGAKDVWVRQPIEVTFSESIKANTLTSDSVRLTVGTTEVAATVSLSADGKKLSVTPSSRILVPNTVKLTLSAAITDLAGTPLSLPADAWTWNLPLSFPIGGLSALPGNTHAATPSLQFTKQGNPVVSWTETVESGSSVWNLYTSTWAGLEWQAFGDTANSTPAWESQYSGIQQVLQVDQSDNPVLAWIHTPETGKGGIYVKRWTGTEWLQLGDLLTAVPQEAPDSLKTSPHALSMALGGNGNPFIAWDQFNEETDYSQVHVWHWTGLKWVEWGTPLNRAVRSDTSLEANVSMVLDPMSRPILSWSDFSPGNIGGIEVRRWTGSHWEELGNKLVALPQPTTAFNPSLLLDSTGSPVLAWSEFSEDKSDIYVRRWTGSAWVPLGEPLSAIPGKTSADHPALQLSTSGSLFIAWTESDGSGAFKTYIRRWTGSTWEAIGAPLEGARGYQTSFKLDASGTPVVSWTYPDGGGIKTIRVHRYNH